MRDMVFIKLTGAKNVLPIYVRVDVIMCVDSGNFDGTSCTVLSFDESGSGSQIGVTESPDEVMSIMGEAIRSYNGN